MQIFDNLQVENRQYYPAEITRKAYNCFIKCCIDFLKPVRQLWSHTSCIVWSTHNWSIQTHRYLWEI